MISYEEVKTCLLSITQADSEELESKRTLIENAICYVEKITKDYTEEDKSRVILLAAARANYYIALLDGNENGITSFKAGDVSFSKGKSSLSESAKTFYESTLAESADLVKSGDFVFRTVD